MRRGLMAWSEKEVPRAVLEGRVTRLQNAMERTGLDTVLVYTSFPRPAAVSWLTHFVPYWSQGLLAVFREGLPLLLVSLSKRVGGWAEETAHVAEVVCTPVIGRSVASLIAKRVPEARRIGVVELAKLPSGIGHPLTAALEGVAIEDASELFAAARHPADDSEIALSRHASDIAHKAMHGVVTANRSAGSVIAALEGAARLDGAEEVVIALAPDLAADRRFRRIEGDVDLGGRFAVRLSIAYKGHWVRLVRSFAGTDDGPTSVKSIEDWLARGLPTLKPGSDVEIVVRTALPDSGGIHLAGINAEACTGCAPLSPLADLPAGAVVSLGLTVEDAEGPWLVGEPVLIGSGDVATQRFALD